MGNTCPKMSDPQPPKFYLDEWLAATDLTLEELAERSGISKTHVTQLKSGKRVWNGRVLLKLAKGLGLSDSLALFRPPGTSGNRPHIWDRIPESRRKQAQRAVDHVLEGFAEPERFEFEAEAPPKTKKKAKRRSP
jgi:transcriptional regulator with XRE-family HTH domain